jgi:phosphoesterase RecJ-like protein
VRDFTAVISVLQKADAWLLVSHEKPDGDTLGSAAALAVVAEALGKRWRWVGKDPIPSSLAFLPFSTAYEVMTSLPEEALEDNESLCLVVVDASTPERALGSLAAYEGKAPLIVLDHHGDNSGYGALSIVDSSAAAVGEMVLDLLEQATEWPFPLEAAEALYTAIVTDTGNFSYANTTERTFWAAAKLVARGVLPSKISERVHSSNTKEGLRLWGLALSRVVSFANGQVACTFLRDEDFIASGCERSNLEGLVNELFRIRNVTFAVFLSEQGGQTHASLRSRGAVSAQPIARSWGGGGHPQAAAFRVPVPLEEVLEKLCSQLEDAYATGDSRFE